MALGKIYAALEQMFGGRINARAATSGQVLTKQSDGTWAGAAAASTGPTYNSTTDVLGGTPDFVESIIIGNSATASQNVRLDYYSTNELSLLGGDGSAQTTTVRVGDLKGFELRGGDGSGASPAGSLTATGGDGGATGAGGEIILKGGAGGGTSGAGGGAQVLGGTPTDGNGGSVVIAGANGVGTNRNGGNVTIRPGSSTGSGTPGAAQVDGRFSLDKGADVASANTVTLGTDGNFFKITGTTTINGIVTLGWQAGSVIHLMFTGALTVTHASGTPGTGAVALLLNAGANMTTAANNTLTLVYDGTNWVELARKV